MSRDGWRPHIESALSIDVWWMDKHGCLRNGRQSELTWSRGGERIAGIRYSVERTYDAGTLTLTYSCEDRDGEREDVTCRLKLTSIPLPYGGLRWYVHCPYTGRRARKLYKFATVPQFCCRQAIRPQPTYASQRVSGTARIQHQRWAIRRRLGDDFSGLMEDPFKPKWMRWATFNKYAQRDAELAEREDASLSPFLYRLLKNSG